MIIFTDMIDRLNRKKDETAAQEAAEAAAVELKKMEADERKRAKKEAEARAKAARAAALAKYRPAAIELYMEAKYADFSVEIKNNTMFLTQVSSGTIIEMTDEEQDELLAAVDAWQLSERARIMDIFTGIQKRTAKK